MKNRISWGLALILTIGWTASAYADGPSDDPRIEPPVIAPAPVNHDFYIGVLAGTTDAGATHDLNMYNGKITDAQSVDLSGGHYGAYAGWRGLHLGHRLSLGVEIAHTLYDLADSVDCHNGCYVCGVELHDSTDLKAMAWFAASERLDLFLGAGVSRASVTSTLGTQDGTGVTGADYDVNGFVAQIGGEYALSQRMALRISIDHREYDNYASPDSISLGTSGLEATSASVGITLRF